MAAFADDDDAAAIDAILKQAPTSKIPELLEEASKRGLDVRSDDLARALDEADPLREYRQQFCFPPPHNGRDAIYLCGHSLGLQPKNTKQAVLEDLERWSQYGVEGHFDQSDAPSTRWWRLTVCASLHEAEPTIQQSSSAMTTPARLPRPLSGQMRSC